VAIVVKLPDATKAVFVNTEIAAPDVEDVIFIVVVAPTGPTETVVPE
jgi:hypothetical protein